jgi:hypothetical protein
MAALRAAILLFGFDFVRRKALPSIFKAKRKKDALCPFSFLP